MKPACLLISFIFYVTLSWCTPIVEKPPDKPCISPGIPCNRSDQACCPGYECTQAAASEKAYCTQIDRPPFIMARSNVFSRSPKFMGIDVSPSDGDRKKLGFGTSEDCMALGSICSPGAPNNCCVGSFCQELDHSFRCVELYVEASKDTQVGKRDSRKQKPCGYENQNPGRCMHNDDCCEGYYCDQSSLDWPTHYCEPMQGATRLPWSPTIAERPTSWAQTNAPRYSTESFSLQRRGPTRCHDHQDCSHTFMCLYPDKRSPSGLCTAPEQYHGLITKTRDSGLIYQEGNNIENPQKRGAGQKQCIPMGFACCPDILTRCCPDSVCQKFFAGGSFYCVDKLTAEYWESKVKTETKLCEYANQNPGSCVWDIECCEGYHCHWLGSQLKGHCDPIGGSNPLPWSPDSAERPLINQRDMESVQQKEGKKTLEFPEYPTSWCTQEGCPCYYSSPCEMGICDNYDERLIGKCRKFRPGEGDDLQPGFPIDMVRCTYTGCPCNKWYDHCWKGACDGVNRAGFGKCRPFHPIEEPRNNRKISEDCTDVGCVCDGEYFPCKNSQCVIKGVNKYGRCRRFDLNRNLLHTRQEFDPKCRSINCPCTKQNHCLQGTCSDYNENGVGKCRLRKISKIYVPKPGVTEEHVFQKQKENKGPPQYFTLEGRCEYTIHAVILLFVRMLTLFALIIGPEY